MPAPLAAVTDAGAPTKDPNPVWTMIHLTDAPTRDAVRSGIERLIVSLLEERAPASSICPSEVARALDPAAWRALMPKIRAIAADLAKAGIIHITQGDEIVSPTGSWRGPIRLRRGAAWHVKP